MHKLAFVVFVLLMIPITTPADGDNSNTLIALDAAVQKIAEGFTWAEGPAEDHQGNLFFTDNRVNKVYKMVPDGTVSTFIEESGGLNGLYTDADGKLLGCSDNPKAIVSIDPVTAEILVVADNYRGVKFNSPNDLWVDSKGGVYFTDPYWRRETGRSRVYYIKPDRKTVIAVNKDIRQPNGVLGSNDGKHLYVTCWKEKKTYIFDVLDDGSLSEKRIFLEHGDDGMTIDEHGNVYLSGEKIRVCAPDGTIKQEIDVPETPANMIFYGPEKGTLLITARTSIYTIEMAVTGK